MTRRLWTWTAIMLIATLPLAAQESEEEAEAPPWSGALGLSYLATSGNTDTSSFGLDIEVKRDPAPWGFAAFLKSQQAQKDGARTAERYFAAIRGERAFGERWSAFAGVSGERDRFQGIDLRMIIEAGGIYNALLGPRHNLSFDAGLTWTRDETTLDETSDSAGMLAGVFYAFQISENATVTERLVYFPNLDESDDWRYQSETALTANINSRWAVKLGYLIRYDNLPVEGFEKRDTTSSASIVMSF
jgi:putative salt-induced outer membrane protein